MKTFAKIGLAVALALVLGVSASAEDRKLIEKKEAKEPTNDREFLVRAIACSVCEVKVGEYAFKNAANEDVRKFAQRMVDDHKKHRNDLLDIARDMKLGVVEGLDKEHQDKFDTLKKLSGSDFDKEYMRMMVEGHEKAVRMYETWSKKAENEKLRDTLAKALPTLREHLDHARKIRDGLKS